MGAQLGQVMALRRGELAMESGAQAVLTSAVQRPFALQVLGVQDLPAEQRGVLSFGAHKVSVRATLYHGMSMIDGEKSTPEAKGTRMSREEAQVASFAVLGALEDAHITHRGSTGGSFSSPNRDGNNSTPHSQGGATSVANALRQRLGLEAGHTASVSPAPGFAPNSGGGCSSSRGGGLCRPRQHVAARRNGGALLRW
jgi:hypothetical protein